MQRQSASDTLRGVEGFQLQARHETSPSMGEGVEPVLVLVCQSPLAKWFYYPGPEGEGVVTDQDVYISVIARQRVGVR